MPKKEEEFELDLEQPAEQQGAQVPENPVELASAFFTPDPKLAEFDDITKDVVLGNLTKKDVNVFVHTGNILVLMDLLIENSRNLINEEEGSEEKLAYYNKVMGNTRNFFRSISAHMIAGGRGLGMATAKLSRTQIGSYTQTLKQDKKRKGLRIL